MGGAPAFPLRTMSTTQHQLGSTTKRNMIATVMSFAVASRAVTVVLMILANVVFPTHDAGGVHKFRPRTFPVGAVSGGGGGGGVFAAFTRWDSAWFLSIADSGYPFPSSSSRAGGRGGDNGAVVDCRGTARAWGGEEYEYELGGYRQRKGKEKEGEQDATWEEGGDGDNFFSSAGTRPRCRPDVPLEEQAHAFFPLYPWLVRWAAAALRALLLPTGFVLDKVDSLVLAAVLISNSCFVAAAVLVYRLGAVVTGDSLLAHRGALAFCVTPASVFFSTAYSESLYAMLSFAGLLVLFSEGRRRGRRTRRAVPSGGGGQAGTETYDNGAAGRRAGRGSNASWWTGAVRAWVAAAFLSLATLTRSNGIAGAGVLVLEKLRWMAGDTGLFNDNSDKDNEDTSSVGVDATLPPLAANARSKKTNTQRWTSTKKKGGSSRAPAVGYSRNPRRRDACAVPWVSLASGLVATGLQALLIIAPYVLVQAYAYRKFCREGKYLVEKDGDEYYDKEGEGGFGSGGTSAAELPRLVVEQLHPWCSWNIPSVYAHVQSAYWDVGTFRYYQWKQIPNFLLAAPALILTAYGTASFFYAQLRSVPATARIAGGVDGGPHFSAGSGGGGGKNSTAARLRRWGVMRHCSSWPGKLANVFFGASKLPHPTSQSFERTGAAALIAQWAFFALFAAVCMNVQVATRFLAAACPPLHWWTASLLVHTHGSRDGPDGNGDGGAGKYKASGRAAVIRTCLRWYLGVYFVVGAVLHANFLPWT